MFENVCLCVNSGNYYEVILKVWERYESGQTFEGEPLFITIIIIIIIIVIERGMRAAKLEKNPSSTSNTHAHHTYQADVHIFHSLSEAQVNKVFHLFPSGISLICPLCSLCFCKGFVDACCYIGNNFHCNFHLFHIPQFCSPGIAPTSISAYQSYPHNFTFSYQSHPQIPMFPCSHIPIFPYSHIPIFPYSPCSHIFPVAGTCPVLCSSNGEYEEGACRCYPGWKGAECSIRHNECEVGLVSS